MKTTAKIFTLDTCVIREICEGNHGLAALLKQEFTRYDYVIQLNSAIRGELERQKFDYRSVLENLEKKFGARIEFAPISKRMSIKAGHMKTRYPTIHPGDDVILTCVIENKSTLVTCDRGLERAAEQAGVRVINPNGSNAQKERQHMQRQRQKPKRRRHWIVNSRRIVHCEQRWQSRHSQQRRNF